MDVKPPMMAAIIAVVVVLLIAGYMAYDRHQKASLSSAPPLSKSQYMPPKPP